VLIASPNFSTLPAVRSDDDEDEQEEEDEDGEVVALKCDPEHTAGCLVSLVRLLEVCALLDSNAKQNAGRHGTGKRLAVLPR